jgi:hypothetical protein
MGGEQLSRYLETSTLAGRPAEVDIQGKVAFGSRREGATQNLPMDVLLVDILSRLRFSTQMMDNYLWI